MINDVDRSRRQPGLGVALAVAAALAGGATLHAGDESDCCYGHGGPGCNDFGCAAIVCAIDTFCCEVQWDPGCAATLAEGSCGGLCTPGGITCPGSGDCCSSNTTPGCDDESCCNLVCAADAACCEHQWDVLCAADAGLLCAGCPGGGSCMPGGNCCQDNGSPGCDDAACCDTVCLADAFCCEVRWDITCAIAASESCDLCGTTCGTGSVGGRRRGLEDCCTSHASPGCDDQFCCASVCAIDPLCCDLAWDALCANQAMILCETCGGGGGGDCCVANPTPGCDDPECQGLICAVDAFCCETKWDSICVDQALIVCEVCGGGCPISCPGDVDADGDVDVQDLVTVIGAWGTDGPTGGDSNCDGVVDVADLLEVILAWGPCPVCPGEGSCFVVNPTPGCEDAGCCEAVCAVDPFCCDQSWDGPCVDQARLLCPPPSL